MLSPSPPTTGACTLCQLTFPKYPPRHTGSWISMAVLNQAVLTDRLVPEEVRRDRQDSAVCRTGTCAFRGRGPSPGGECLHSGLITETKNWKWSPGLGVLSRSRKHPGWMRQTSLPAIPNYTESSAGFNFIPWALPWCRDRKLCPPCLQMFLVQ